LIRVRAGISFALSEAMDDGHCGLPEEELVPLAQKLLEVPADLITTALALEIQEGTVIVDDLEGARCVFLAGLYRAEREIEERLRALAFGKPPWPLIDADKAIPWVESRTKLALAETQKRALRSRSSRKCWSSLADPVSARPAHQLTAENPACQSGRHRPLRSDRSSCKAPIRKHRP
jgi:exodeoxyribonuclease V alpha subunit